MKRTFKDGERVVCVRYCCDVGCSNSVSVESGDIGKVRLEIFYPDKPNVITYLNYNHHDISTCFESLEKKERTMFNHFEDGDTIEALHNVFSVLTGELLWIRGNRYRFKADSSRLFDAGDYRIYRNMDSPKDCDYTMHFKKVNTNTQKIEEIESTIEDLKKQVKELKWGC